MLLVFYVFDCECAVSHAVAAFAERATFAHPALLAGTVKKVDYVRGCELVLVKLDFEESRPFAPHRTDANISNPGCVPYCHISALGFATVQANKWSSLHVVEAVRFYEDRHFRMCHLKPGHTAGFDTAVSERRCRHTVVSLLGQVHGLLHVVVKIPCLAGLFGFGCAACGHFVHHQPLCLLAKAKLHVRCCAFNFDGQRQKSWRANSDFFRLFHLRLR